MTLSGELGAGKTAFARALIRSLTGDADIEVPSPTFTLMQIYDGLDFPIVHADLYRIRHPDELEELGWDEAAEGALVLLNGRIALESACRRTGWILPWLWTRRRMPVSVARR